MSRILLISLSLSILACDLNLQEQTTTFIDERPVQVTDDGLLKSNPAWSSEGELIAFSARLVITKFTQRSFEGVEQAVVARLVGSQDIGRSKMALSPDGQKLAYRNTRIGHVWIADLQQGSQTLLTQEHSDAREPAWSPDGAWIAYVARVPNSGFRHLWMMPAAGGAPTRLTTDEINDSSPSWSADGRRIAFYRITTAGTRAVWILNVAARTVEQITPDSTRSRSPAWSPDGSTIAFVSSINDTTTIWTVAAEGGPARKFTDAFRSLVNPAWSPDGLKIAGRSFSRIVVMSNTGEDIIVTPLSEEFPIWLPDSESFLATEFINSSNIYVLSLADTVATRVTGPADSQFDSQPTWFPGENRIAFSRRSAFFQVQIWTTTYPGAEESLVVEVPPEVSPLNPDFSPDGSRVAIEYGRDIFTLRLETGEIRFLPRTTGSRLRDPSWSPDGTQLACISDFSFNIFRMDSNPFRQTAEVGGSYRSISWSPLNAKFGSHIAVQDRFERIFITSPANLQLEQVVLRGEYPDWSPDATKLAYILNGEVHILKVLVEAGE